MGQEVNPVGKDVFALETDRIRTTSFKSYIYGVRVFPFVWPFHRQRTDSLRPSLVENFHPCADGSNNCVGASNVRDVKLPAYQVARSEQGQRRILFRMNDDITNSDSRSMRIEIVMPSYLLLFFDDVGLAASQLHLLFGNVGLLAGNLRLSSGVAHKDESKEADRDSGEPLNQSVINVQQPQRQKPDESWLAVFGALCVLGAYALCTYLALCLDKFKVRRYDIEEKKYKNDKCGS